MTVLEIDQGRYRDLTGTPMEQALARLRRDAADFLAHNPECTRWYSPCWREREVGDHEHAPWGCEWYVVDADGRLSMHSAQYDSSG